MSISIESSPHGNNRREILTGLASSRWSLVVVLALAAGLRLVNLGGRPMWYDEAFAVLYAEKPLATMLYGTVTRAAGAAADVHPIFFYSILHAWMKAAGQSPLAVRCLSLVLGVTTVAVVFLLARRLFDARAGLVAAVVVALAPFHIYYSQEARMYALLGFVTIAMTYFFVRAWMDGGWVNWVVFGCFGALTLYAHNLGFAFVAALDAWILWSWLSAKQKRWSNLGRVVLSHLLMLILFAPWLLVLPGQFGKIQQAYWIEQPGIVQLIQTLLIFHFAYDNQSLPGWLLPAALLFSLLIPTMIVFHFMRQPGATRRSQTEATGVSFPAPFLLLACLILVPVGLIFLLSFIRPVFIIRALLPSALMYYLLLGATLANARMPRVVKLGLAVPWLAIVVVSLVNHYTYVGFPRAPFDRAVADLHARIQPGDVVVHSNKLTYLPAYYYDRLHYGPDDMLQQAFIADEPGSPTDTLAYPTQQALGLYAEPDVATATRGAERVWFVFFQREVGEYLAAGLPDHPDRAWLEEHYNLVSVQSFYDLSVCQYQSGVSPVVLLGPEVGP